MRLRWSALLLLALPAAGQYDPKQPLPEHVIVLSKARLAAQKEFAHIPNFVCNETVERAERLPRQPDFKVQDTLRLQVTVTAGGEVRAPEGAASFDQKAAAQYSRTGLTSTGDFSSHLKTIFFSSVPTFEYAGREMSDGRPFVRFRFRVPKTLSGYVLQVPPNQATIGYDGDLWFDAENMDLAILEIDGTEIPPTFAIQRVQNRIQFRRVEIGGQMRLLPRESELLLSYFDGRERRNRARFSSCRQFVGETKLTFDPPQ